LQEFPVRVQEIGEFLQEFGVRLQENAVRVQEFTDFRECFGHGMQ